MKIPAWLTFQNSLFNLRTMNRAANAQHVEMEARHCSKFSPESPMVRERKAILNFWRNLAWPSKTLPCVDGGQRFQIRFFPPSGISVMNTKRTFEKNGARRRHVKN